MAYCYQTRIYGMWTNDDDDDDDDDDDAACMDKEMKIVN
jgi:hypothetical protein